MKKSCSITLCFRQCFLLSDHEIQSIHLKVVFQSYLVPRVSVRIICCLKMIKLKIKDDKKNCLTLFHFFRPQSHILPAVRLLRCNFAWDALVQKSLAGIFFRRSNNYDQEVAGKKVNLVE